MDEMEDPIDLLPPHLQMAMRAVEDKFDVKVEKVATMNRKGKSKQMTVRSGGRPIRTEGTQSSWKRAVVTLQDGFTIDLLKGEAQV